MGQDGVDELHASSVFTGKAAPSWRLACSRGAALVSGHVFSVGHPRCFSLGTFSGASSRPARRWQRSAEAGT